MTLAETTSRQGARIDDSTRFQQVRTFSEKLCETLTPEDCVIQSMPDVSPTRWHLAHTTWFFETFVLRQLESYQPLDERFGYLFNSYYNAVGKQYPRPHRGLLSRPGFQEILEYRRHVDRHLIDWLESGGIGDLGPVVQVGLQHERQHQELLLTDIKHVFFCNPLLPCFQELEFDQAEAGPASSWLDFDSGLHEFGCHRGGVGCGDGKSGFAFDNESPRHRQWLDEFSLATNLVTCGEYLEFIQAGGYRRPELWLSAGWATVTDQQWRAPLYWVEKEGTWHEFTLAGLVPLDPERPVTHVSYFEADAFARFKGCRLPTEYEWELAAQETAASQLFVDHLFAKRQPIHPRVDQQPSLFGNTWQWTASQYTAYPGYRPPAGAIGEYNGKFMCNQFVLRGGSCATSSDHIRTTYRNFFQPEARWQFSGIRLAQ